MRVSERVTSSGVVLLDRDGLVYIREVAGGFGGYDWSFAKGRLEPGISLEENALRELREEMGLEARIVGELGDYEARPASPASTSARLPAATRARTGRRRRRSGSSRARRRGHS